METKLSVFNLLSIGIMLMEDFIIQTVLCQEKDNFFTEALRILSNTSLSLVNNFSES